MAERRAGRVVALQANFCQVELDAPGPAERRRLLCTRRTRLAKSGERICVGDRVVVDGLDWSAGRAAVAAVESRSSLLLRPAVANVDRVLVVVALVEPALDPLQLTRFLITAEASGCGVQVVFSKADLVAPQLASHWCERVQGWGYPALAVSGVSGAGLEPLRAALSEPGLSVLCGPSGVGKSSLLNALLPALQLRTAELSGRLRRGRHTTRHVELFALAPGALVADSPGFNRPQLPRDPAALAALFPELRAALAGRCCRFRDCRHQGDPGCVLAADWDRRALYGQCLLELEGRAQPRPGDSGAEPAGLRRRGGLRQRGGRLEPLLDPRLRQISRRRARQDGPGEDESGLSPPGPAD